MAHVGALGPGPIAALCPPIVASWYEPTVHVWLCRALRLRHPRRCRRRYRCFRQRAENSLLKGPLKADEPRCKKLRDRWSRRVSEEKKQGQYTTNYLPEHSPFSGTPYPCHSPFTLYNFHRHLPDQPFVHISWKVWLIGPSCAQRELCSVFPLFHHHFSSKMATRWRNALGLYKTYHVTCCWPVQTHNIHVGCRYYKIYCKIIKSRTFGNLLKWLVFIFSYQ